MSRQFFTDVRKIEPAEKPEYAVKAGIDVLLTQASKMSVIRPNADTLSAVDILKTLSKTTSDVINRPAQNVNKEDKITEEPTNAFSPK